MTIFMEDYKMQNLDPDLKIDFYHNAAVTRVIECADFNCYVVGMRNISFT